MGMVIGLLGGMALACAPLNIQIQDLNFLVEQGGDRGPEDEAECLWGGHISQRHRCGGVVGEDMRGGRIKPCGHVQWLNPGQLTYWMARGRHGRAIAIRWGNVYAKVHPSLRGSADAIGAPA
jgi:hypothetical protein